LRKVVASTGPLSGALLAGGALTDCAEEAGVRSRREAITIPIAVEATAIRLLEEYKPGRNLQTNVEFFTALLLHGLGLEVPLFTPTFSISRVAGWIAHALEQRTDNRIIRPQSVYVGPKGRSYNRALCAS